MNARVNRYDDKLVFFDIIDERGQFRGSVTLARDLSGTINTDFISLGFGSLEYAQEKIAYNPKSSRDSMLMKNLLGRLRGDALFIWKKSTEK